MQAFHIHAAPPLYTNTFLLIGENKNAVIIDPAADPEKYKNILKKEQATLTHLFLTHGHHDHIGAIEALRQTTDAKLYMHAADAKQFGIHADELYADGDEIVIDDMAFQVIHTPGHTPGCVCLLCDDLLFSGDTLFAGEIGRCDLEGGDYPTMLKSLRKLCECVTIDAQVLPGHEEFSSMEAEKAGNHYIALARGDA